MVLDYATVVVIERIDGFAALQIQRACHEQEASGLGQGVFNCRKYYGYNNAMPEVGIDLKNENGLLPSRKKRFIGALLGLIGFGALQGQIAGLWMEAGTDRGRIKELEGQMVHVTRMAEANRHWIGNFGKMFLNFTHGVTEAFDNVNNDLQILASAIRHLELVDVMFSETLSNFQRTERVKDYYTAMVSGAQHQFTPEIMGHDTFMKTYRQVVEDLSKQWSRGDLKPAVTQQAMDLAYASTHVIDTTLEHATEVDSYFAVLLRIPIMGLAAEPKVHYSEYVVYRRDNDQGPYIMCPSVQLVYYPPLGLLEDGGTYRTPTKGERCILTGGEKCERLECREVEDSGIVRYIGEAGAVVWGEGTQVKILNTSTHNNAPLVFRIGKLPVSFSLSCGQELQVNGLAVAAAFSKCLKNLTITQHFGVKNMPRRHALNLTLSHAKVGEVLDLDAPEWDDALAPYWHPRGSGSQITYWVVAVTLLVVVTLVVLWYLRKTNKGCWAFKKLTTPSSKDKETSEMIELEEGAIRTRTPTAKVLFPASWWSAKPSAPPEYEKRASAVNLA
jgi:hypothetical protein